MARDPEGRGREYLQQWHERHTGATSVVVGGWVGADGRTPYDVVADADGGAGALVVDLACGDGLLLEVLQRRSRGVGIGIDLNGAELSAARGRLGTGVPLVRGDAAHLPFRTGSIGVVTCHFALMLLQR